MAKTCFKCWQRCCETGHDDLNIKKLILFGSLKCYLINKYCMDDCNRVELIQSPRMTVNCACKEKESRCSSVVETKRNYPHRTMKKNIGVFTGDDFRYCRSCLQMIISFNKWMTFHYEFIKKILENLNAISKQKPWQFIYFNAYILSKNGMRW